MSSSHTSTVVAKMRCIESKVDMYATTIRLQPVYAEDGPNKSWSKATPSGEVTMQITNPTAATFFRVGKSYLVNFAETED